MQAVDPVHVVFLYQIGLRRALNLQHPKLHELEDLSLRQASAARVSAVTAGLEPLGGLEKEHGYDLGDVNAEPQFGGTPVLRGRGHPVEPGHECASTVRGQGVKNSGARAEARSQMSPQPASA